MDTIAKTDGRTNRWMDGGTDKVIPTYSLPNFVCRVYTLIYLKQVIFLCSKH